MESDANGFCRETCLVAVSEPRTSSLVLMSSALIHQIYGKTIESDAFRPSKSPSERAASYWNNSSFVLIPLTLIHQNDTGAIEGNAIVSSQAIRSPNY